MSKRIGVALGLMALVFLAVLALRTQPVASQAARIELAPAAGSATAGTPFSIVVTAYLSGDNVDTGYDGTVHFTSSDPGATLPPDYTFVPATDNGSHAFTQAIVLRTSGSRTVTVTDNAYLADTETWTVAPAFAARLQVTGPAAVTASATGELTVTARDAYGNVATSYSGLKELVFSGPAAAPGGNAPTVEDVELGLATPVTFTSGVSNAGTATLMAYAAGPTAVDVSDGVIGSSDSAEWDLDLTVNPGPPAGLEISGAGSVTAGAATELTVTARDAYGNTAASYSGEKDLSFSGPAAAPGGQTPTVENVTIGEPTAVSFTDGISASGTATLVVYAAGQTGVAVTDGLIGSTASAAYGLDLAVTPAPAASLEVAPAGGPASAGLPFPFTVSARDPYGNTDTVYAGAVLFTSSDPNATLPAGAAFALPDRGARAFAATLRTAGDQTITVTDDADPDLAGTATWSVSATSIDHYAVTSDNHTQTAGTPFAVTVTASDAFDNIVTGDNTTPVILTTTSGTMLFDGDGDGQPGELSDNVMVLSSGVLIFQATDSLAGAGVTITATDIDERSGTSDPYTILAAPAIDHYTVTSDNYTQVAGEVFTVAVTAFDSFGNVVLADNSTSVVISSSSATLIFDGNGNNIFNEPGDDVRQLSSGTATIAAADTTAHAAITITATDGTSRSGTSGPYEITAAALDHYTVTSASYDQAAGISFTVTVTARDAFDNVITTDSSTPVTLTSSSGTTLFDGNRNGTFGEPGDNVAQLSSGTFDIAALEEAAESITITATDDASRAGTSLAYAISGTAALAFHHYTVTSESYAQQVTVSFTVTVAATDADGNPAARDNVTITLSSNLAALIFDGNGNGTFGEEGDDRGTMTAGALEMAVKATVTADNVTITATDADGNTAVSQTYTIEDFRCFIATAAYGTPMSEEIQVLRDFRDQYLMATPPGRLLVSAYYRCSPPIARFIGRHDGLRAVVRAVLAPVIWSTNAFMASTRPEKLALLTLAIATATAALWLRLRRAAA